MAFKNLLQNHQTNFNQTWQKASLGESSNEELFNFQKIDNGFFSSPDQHYGRIVMVESRVY